MKPEILIKRLDNLIIKLFEKDLINAKEVEEIYKG